MRSKLKGYSLLFSSVFIYGLYGIFTKFTSDYFPPFILSALREGLSVTIILILTLLGISKWKKVLKSDIVPLLVLGLASALANLGMYYTFSLLPVGLGMFIMYSTIIVFSWALGVMLLKEKVTKIGIISVILAFIGFLIMFKLKGEGINIIGILSALGYGFMIAVFATATKYIKGEYGALQIYVFGGGVPVIIGTIFAFVFKEQFPVIAMNSSWIWLVIFGIAAVFASGTYLWGLSYKVEISIACIIMTLETVVGAVAGYLIFHEILSPRTIIGGVLILAAAITPYLPELLKTIKSRRKLNAGTNSKYSKGN